MKNLKRVLDNSVQMEILYREFVVGRNRKINKMLSKADFRAIDEFVEENFFLGEYNKLTSNHFPLNEKNKVFWSKNGVCYLFWDSKLAYISRNKFERWFEDVGFNDEKYVTYIQSKKFFAEDSSLKRFQIPAFDVFSKIVFWEFKNGIVFKNSLFNNLSFPWISPLDCINIKKNLSEKKRNFLLSRGF